MCHLSQVPWEISHITCHMSQVTFHLSIMPTATHLPLMTPPSSTVDSFQIYKKKKKLSWTKNVVTIVLNFEPIMQFWHPSRLRILRTIQIHYILWRKVLKPITLVIINNYNFYDRKNTNKHTDMATLWPTQPRGPSWWKSTWETNGLRNALLNA